MISAIINKFRKKTVVIVSSISVGIVIVAGLIILFCAGASKTEGAFNYQAIAKEYCVSENVAYLIGRTQQYNENADIKMLANMSITKIADNLRIEYVNVFQYKKIAQEHGVSQDVAYIANRIVMIDSNADMELLVNLPITELVDILREKLLQPQTPAAEETAQGTEVAFTDEAEDADTEDANDETVKDVDIENDDTNTPNSGTNSGDTNPEEPKPTKKPEEKPQEEWSEWSAWMSNQDMWNIINSQYSGKEIQVDKQKAFYRNTIEVFEQRYKHISLEWTEWQRVPDDRNTLSDLYPSDEYGYEEILIDGIPHFRAGKIPDWSEWMPAPLEDKYYDEAKYDIESRVDTKRSTFSPWRDTVVADGYTDYDLQMFFERFRWR